MLKKRPKETQPWGGNTKPLQSRQFAERGFDKKKKKNEIFLEDTNADRGAKSFL